MTPQLSQTPISGHQATALRFPKTGSALHFYHANGFSARCYKPFLQEISTHYTVSALNMRPVWPSQPQPDRRIGWAQYGEDLIAWLDATADAPTLAVAHSMGAATTAMAAIKRPDLFRGLVLIEPAGISAQLDLFIRMIPYALRAQLGPAKDLTSRRSKWADADSLYDEFRSNRAYKRFSDDLLRQLVHAMTEETDAGRQLHFPLHWEAHNYVFPAQLLPTLRRLKVPTHIIAAKPSIFVDPAMLTRLGKMRPDIPVTHLPKHGHLLPLEAAGPAAQATLAALNDLS